MKIAIVGCGYVADFYMANARSHSDFSFAGIWDRDPERLATFCKFYSVPAAASLEEILGNPEIEMVLNLTNPRDHFTVSSAILKAKKHLYTEKPLGMTGEESQELVALAKANDLRIGCAPCSVLSDTAQTLGKAIREGAVGKVRMVYANYDDGMIAPKEAPWNWKSASGAPWPAKDEFEIGCTYEHAGYYMTWLAAFFGPARSVTAFASTQIPAKGIPVDGMAPDFSVGCVEYDDGVVARVTAGLVAPEDKSLTVIGDEGYLYVRHLRNDKHAVMLHRDTRVGGLKGKWAKVKKKLRSIAHHRGWDIGNWGLFETYPGINLGTFAEAGHNKPVDFFRGPQDMHDAIRSGQPHRLSAELGLHVVEIIETLQYPERYGYHRKLTSEFPPIAPLTGK